ncbi:hypothetical protein LX87_04596 [Larkinella arboricola]|uniref:Uncharacterized protein n=1 Tax=Larkinella arboricola TaxID=643671 RepID=A0A327WNJ9_LARAB|nr:hypothetical protein LX87_04596 [Larkinella arboricola]
MGFIEVKDGSGVHNIINVAHIIGIKSDLNGYSLLYLTNDREPMKVRYSGSDLKKMLRAAVGGAVIDSIPKDN